MYDLTTKQGVTKALSEVQKYSVVGAAAAVAFPGLAVLLAPLAIATAATINKDKLVAALVAVNKNKGVSRVIIRTDKSYGAKIAGSYMGARVEGEFAKKNIVEVIIET